MIRCYIILMRVAAQLLVLVAAPLLASCDRPAIEPSQSLVGAEQLPSSGQLSRESIYISRGHGDWGQRDPGRLAYELLPDGRLEITHSVYDRGERILGAETFRL